MTEAGGVCKDPLAVAIDHIFVHNPQGQSTMNRTIESQVSRRTTLSLLGVAGALTFAVPAPLLTMSEAEAQTPGMERREDRREDRQDRREDRQEGRQERRDDRQQGREDRRSGDSQPATTDSTTSDK